MPKALPRLVPFVLAWLGGIAVLIWAGTRVDGYMLHVQGVPLPHPYPTSGVAWFSVLLTLEVAVLYAIVRPLSFHLSVGRLVVVVVLGAPYLFGHMVMTMHAPPYVALHWLWLAAAWLVALVALVVVIVARVARRRA